MLETHAYRKFNFQHYRENNMSQIIAFWSNVKAIKMPRNVVFKVNRDIKMSRNSKIIQKTGEIKMPRKLFA